MIVLNCGGTIDMSGNDQRKTAALVGSIAEKQRAVFDKSGVSFELEQVFDRSPDSSNIGEVEWQCIFSRVVAIAERKNSWCKTIGRSPGDGEYGGIVITHGTDTLQTSSFILSLMLATKDLTLPVILTASHAPMDQPESDGWHNFRKAIFAAKKLRSVPGDTLRPGVYVLIGHELHLPGRLVKVFTRPGTDGRYFFSYPAPIGTVVIRTPRSDIRTSRKGDNVRVPLPWVTVSGPYWRRLKATLVPAPNAQWGSMGIVEHQLVDCFSLPQVVYDVHRRIEFYRSQFASAGRRIGVVIQGDFSRNRHFPEILTILHGIYKDDVTVWVGSKHVLTRALASDTPPFLNLIDRSLSHSKAREKLSWLLGFSFSREELADWMNRNLVGEIFKTSDLPEWINHETFPPNCDGREIVIAYPNISWRVYKDAIERLRSSKRTLKELVVYGFGDGHIPVSNESVAKITKDYLVRREFPRAKEIQLPDELGALLRWFVEYMRDTEGILSYLATHYVIQKPAVFRVIASELASELLKTGTRALHERIGSALEHLQVDQRLTFEPTCLDVIVNPLRRFLHVRKEAIANVGSAFIGEANEGIALEKIIGRFPILIAKRLVRDAIVSSHPVLGCIGEAIDTGIVVRVKTLAAKSRTDLKLYEIGNKLQIVGCEGDLSRGWRTDYLVERDRSLLQEA